uniref:Uncharacterized protein n=1 Tax=viral metagenome TaxID=1070528 RepID=A0A6C0FAN5_9ZZZZ
MDSHELFPDESIYDGIGTFQMKELFNIICLKFRKEMNDVCYQACLENGELYDIKFGKIVADRDVCDKVFDTLRKDLQHYILLYLRAEKYLKDFSEIRLSGLDAIGLYEWKSFQEYIDNELGVRFERIGPYDYTKFVSNMRESASFANGMRLKYSRWLTECMIKNSIISTINR